MVFKETYELMTLKGPEPFVANIEDKETLSKIELAIAYFDINRDTLLLDVSSMVDISRCGVQIPILSRIKYLGLKYRFFGEIGPAQFDQLKLFERVDSMFPSLRTFSWIKGPLPLDNGNALKLVHIDDSLKHCIFKTFLSSRYGELRPKLSYPRETGRHIEEAEITELVKSAAPLQEMLDAGLNKKNDGDTKKEIRMVMVAREVVFEPDVFKAMLTEESPVQFYSYLYIKELGCYVGHRTGNIETKIVSRMETRDSFERESRHSFFRSLGRRLSRS
jgi:hypothetical protein